MTTVRAPDGRTWIVRRQLRWPRWRRFGSAPGEGWFEVADAASLFTFDSPTAFVASLLIAIVIVVVVTVVIVVFLPLVVFVVELVIVAAATLLLGGAWSVVARTEGPPPKERRWHVRGIRGSRRAVAEIADELSRGVEAAPSQ